jgi:hypothetical protein
VSGKAGKAMTITIQLSDEAQKKLEQMAAARGFTDVAAYIQDLVENKVHDAAFRESLLEFPDNKDLPLEFAHLADQWRKERGATSMAKRMAEHPAYRKIVAMGEKAVPLILAELERQPDHWFFALHEITGANPVPEKSRGNLPQMAQAWLDWGRKQGYRW